MSDHEIRLIGPQMRSELSHTRLSKLDLFCDLRFIKNIRDPGLSVNDATFDHELEYYSKFCGLSVGLPVNRNHTDPRKDLLLWNCNLGSIMYLFREFIR